MADGAEGFGRCLEFFEALIRVCSFHHVFASDPAGFKDMMKLLKPAGPARRIKPLPAFILSLPAASPFAVLKV
jgi:hypothetical protein